MTYPRSDAPPLLMSVADFDRSPVLAVDEHAALRDLQWDLRRRRGHDAGRPEWAQIDRLLAPLDAARLALRDRPDTQLHHRSSKDAGGLVLHRCLDEGATYWGWSEDAWVRLIGEDRHAFARPWPGWIDSTVRPYVAAYAYLLCGFDAFHRLGAFNRVALICRIFGREAVERALEAISAKLEGWGYRSARSDERLRMVICQALLVNRSPRVEDLTDAALARLRSDPRMGWRPRTLHAIHRAVAGLGHATPPPIPTRGRRMPVEGAPMRWMECVNRWYDTSTLSHAVRREYRSILAKTGRWLTVEQPGVETPDDWTRETCAAWVVRVIRMTVGDFAQRRVGLSARLGRPLAASSRASYITVIRTFFRACHEWGWCARRFDPTAMFATPKSIQMLIGPKPRAIADDAWAKLLWAGLNRTADDIAAHGIKAYPVELVRAVALTAVRRAA